MSFPGGSIPGYDPGDDSSSNDEEEDTEAEVDESQTSTGGGGSRDTTLDSGTSGGGSSGGGSDAGDAVEDDAERSTPTNAPSGGSDGEAGDAVSSTKRFMDQMNGGSETSTGGGGSRETTLDSGTSGSGGGEPTEEPATEPNDDQTPDDDTTTGRGSRSVGLDPGTGDSGPTDGTSAEPEPDDQQTSAGGPTDPAPEEPAAEVDGPGLAEPIADPTQGLEETADDPNIQQQAREIESDFLADNNEFDPEDVRVVRQGEDKIGLELTVTGDELVQRQAEMASEQALEGLGFQGVGTGNLQAPDAAGSQTLAEQRAQREYEDALEGLGFQGVGTGIVEAPSVESTSTTESVEAAQSQAREEIERQLEAEVGVDLDDEDIAYSADDDRVTGELSNVGQQTVAAEKTPFQNTAISPILEDFAVLGVKGRQFRDRNVQRAQEYTDLDNLFAGSEEFLGDVDEYGLDPARDAAADTVEAIESASEIGPAGLLGVEEQDVDVTGGTLPVFSGVGAGGGAAGVGRATKAAGAATGLGIAGAGAAATGDNPTARAEVELPESGEQFTQDELTMPNRPGVFADEVPIPDPAAMDTGPLGVPEQGVTIDVTDDPGIGQATEIEPTDPVTTTDIETPTEEPTDPFVRTSPQQAQQGQQSGSDVVQNERRRVERSQDRQVVPDEFLPDDNQRIGYGRGRSYGRTRRFGQAREIGRTFDEDDFLTLPEERFLSFDAETPSSLDLLDSVQQAEATSGQRPGADVYSAPFEDSAQDIATAADVDVGIDLGLTPSQDVAAQGIGMGTDTFDVPAIEEPGYGFPEPTGTTTDFPAPTVTTPGTDTPDRRKRMPLPEFDDDKRKDKKDDAFGTGLFENPVLAPDELGEFEDDLLDGLDDF